MKTVAQKFFVVVFFVMSLSAVASAQSKIGLKGLGAKLGYVSPEGIYGGTVMYEAMADLGEFSSKVKFGGRLGYWSSSANFDTLSGGVSKSDFILGGTAIVPLSIQGGKYKPYFGAGLSLNFLNTSYDDALPQETRNLGGSELEIGLDATVGVRYALNDKLDGVGDVMWTLGGESEQFAIRVGILFKISD